MESSENTAIPEPSNNSEVTIDSLGTRLASLTVPVNMAHTRLYDVLYKQYAYGGEEGQVGWADWDVPDFEVYDGSNPRAYTVTFFLNLRRME